MDAEQLWKTTMNPATRMLKQVEIEDAQAASDLTALLMGNEVQPRKEYIYSNATEANLDVWDSIIWFFQLLLKSKSGILA